MILLSFALLKHSLIPYNKVKGIGIVFIGIKMSIEYFGRSM